MVLVAASSSNFIWKKNEVFISFRGEDTRDDFTRDLYDEFCDKKIKAYIDEESLRKGDEISPALLEAIEESEISVIILSKDYASSRWCLDELNHILWCKETNKQIVVPVFYVVNPSEVQKLEGSYAYAFEAHEERFKDQSEKLKKWRNSLTTVGGLSGFHSSNYRSNYQLIKAIVEDISKKLCHRMLPCDEFKDLVGIDRRIHHVESLLNIDSLDDCIVGIWGMGGIGKTTLASAIFNRFAHQFEGRYFLENVREESKKHGLTYLQRKLSSKLLGKEIERIDQRVKRRLHETRVLIVLDDVEDAKQLEYLAGEGDHWFGRGSKIIITTRNIQVLMNFKVVKEYMVEELNLDESWKLFCSKAFPQSFPTPYYDDLSAWIVRYSKGIPLVLTILGRHLRSKSIEEWKSELEKLKKIPNKEVLEVLKISYDGLDCNEKEIFLDIACFFQGEDQDIVKRVLQAYGNRYVDSGVRVLIDKALISITFNRFYMHDLLQEMGWNIIFQESEEPGNRSRLWLSEDILQVLKHNTGTKAIQGIFLETRDIKEGIRLDPLVFKNMYNLKYLKFCNLCSQMYLRFTEGLECLPDELRYLSWSSYPLKSLPSSFKPINLVELRLSWSNLEHLWKGVLDLANLKVLDLHDSHNLIQIPNLSRAVNLEQLNLSYCERLENLPSSIGKLKSLQYLWLYHCYNFNQFPELPVSLKYLDMEGTSIEEVTSSINCLSHLETFNLSTCKKLKSLSFTIFKLKSLRSLNLSNCVELKSFPEISEPMEQLTMLDLSEAGITELPSSIGNLLKLQSLDLRDCKNLQLFPNTICSMPITLFSFENFPKLENLPPLSIGLHCLSSLDLDDSSVSEIHEVLFYLPLEYLSLCRTRIKTIPENIKYSKLFHLNIMDCKSLESLPKLPLSLKEVFASGCTSLKVLSNSSIETVSKTSSLLLSQMPDYMKNYQYSEELEFIDCSMLDPKEITTEFQTRALRLGTEVLSIQKQITDVEQTNFSDLGVSICFPGVEIPKWFNYRNDNGCSIVAQPNCYDTTNFIGFASCVVVSCELNHKSTINDFSFACCCDINVETNNGRMCYNFVTGELDGFKNYSGSNHVLMWYFHRFDIDIFLEKEISFNFHIVARNSYGTVLGGGGGGEASEEEEEEKEEEEENNEEEEQEDEEDEYEEEEEEKEKESPMFKVERCGIRMLQLQDAKKFGIISSEFVQEEEEELSGDEIVELKTSKEEPSEDEIVKLEMNEPHPKRAKFSS